MYRSKQGQPQWILKRLLAVELLESRQLLTASVGWDGPGQGSADLSYYIANAAPNLSLAETQAAIETALDAWAGAADLTFTPTDQPGQDDSLDISFTPLDGSGGTLAQAYFPDDVNRSHIAGDIQFDSAEAWEVGNGLGRQAFDLVYIAVHEIGHALGLDHAHHSDSILAPTVSPQDAFKSLSEHDIEEIQELYAAPELSMLPTNNFLEVENQLTPHDHAFKPTVPANRPEQVPPSVPPNSGSDKSPTSPNDGQSSEHWLHRWFRFGNWSLNYNSLLSPTNTQPPTIGPTPAPTLLVVTIVLHRPSAHRFIVPVSNETLAPPPTKTLLPQTATQLNSSRSDIFLQPGESTSDDDQSTDGHKTEELHPRRVVPNRRFILRRFVSFRR